MGESAAPIPVFLAVAQRALQQQFGWHLERVSTVVFAPFYPQNLDGLTLLFAFPVGEKQHSSFEIILRSERRQKDLVTVGVTTGNKGNVTRSDVVSGIETPSKPPPKLASDDELAIGAIIPSNSQFALLPIRCPALLVFEPDRIDVAVLKDGTRHELGSFCMGFLRTPGLSRSEVQDYVSRKTHVAYIRSSCEQCGESINIYASLFANDDAGTVPEPHVSVRTVGDEWSCKCGQTVVPTKFLKLGIHELFRANMAPGEEPMRFLNYYEQSMIAHVISEYSELIHSQPAEPDVQKFLEENQILWAFLGPLEIIPQPRVLTHHVGDFAIVTTTRTLFLVEIEKPQTALAKQKGGQSAEIQKGLDQINQWRQTVEDHRIALLDELRIDRSQVDDIKFILVGGLASATRASELRSLRQSMPADTTFYTFDELSRLLAAFVDASPKA